MVAQSWPCLPELLSILSNVFVFKDFKDSQIRKPSIFEWFLAKAFYSALVRLFPSLVGASSSLGQGFLLFSSCREDFQSK